jgi:hypothetical protein
MADRTTSSIVIGMPREEIMAVIADFAAYPEWATGVRGAEVLATADGRPARVRFTLDVGLIKDTYVLGYDWDGDARVHWNLAEPGSVISEMSGGYELADGGNRTEVTYELTVGIKMPLPGIVKRRAEKTIIDTALKGLKSRAEAIGRAE